MRTSQPPHTDLASFVEAPRSGKNRSGSTPRQFARSCQRRSAASTSRWINISRIGCPPGHRGTGGGTSRCTICGNTVVGITAMSSWRATFGFARGTFTSWHADAHAATSERELQSVQQRRTVLTAEAKRHQHVVHRVVELGDRQRRPEADIRFGPAPELGNPADRLDAEDRFDLFGFEHRGALVAGAQHREAHIADVAARLRRSRTSRGSGRTRRPNRARGSRRGSASRAGRGGADGPARSGRAAGEIEHDDVERVAQRLRTSLDGVVNLERWARRDTGRP